MVKYLKEHEVYINELLKQNSKKVDFKEILNNHRVVVANLQHERLIHLLVTLTFGFIFIVFMTLTLLLNLSSLIVFNILVLILLIPYIFHYYCLENGVQRLYKLDKELVLKINQ